MSSQAVHHTMACTAHAPRSVNAFSAPSVTAPLRRAAAHLLLACAALVVAAPHDAVAARKAPVASAYAFEPFNSATDSPLLRMGSRGAAVTRAQILLDRAWFSVGEIDGAYAANMRRMVRAYQSSRGLKVTGTVTPETWAALRAEPGADEPLLEQVTISEKDAAGPFVEKIPADMTERSKLEALHYTNVREALAERHHASPALLKTLNPKSSFGAGEEIAVPSVKVRPAPTAAAAIEIHKSERVLWVVDKAGKPLAAFPVSFGGSNDPLEIGTMTIKNEVHNPDFTYDSSLMWDAKKQGEKVRIAPGPNNPVGTAWLGLSKKHWGIHGTPEPSRVGHSESHGCIHLTNWDVMRLSTLAKPGFKVDVKE